MIAPISINELKLLTGSSAADALLQYFIDANTNLLANFIDVGQFDKHDITERAKTYHQYLYPEQQPVNTVASITKIDDTEIDVDVTIEGFHSLLLQQNNVDVHLHGLVKILYNAGWQLEEIISIDTNPSNDETLIITDASTATTYTFKTSPSADTDVQIGVDTDATAVNLAAVLETSSTSSLVTLPVGSAITPTAKITVNTSADFPVDLKMALAMMVNASLGDQTASAGNKVKSFSVGSKTVQYMNTNEQGLKNENIFENLVKKYISRFRRSFISSV